MKGDSHILPESLERLVINTRVQEQVVNTIRQECFGLFDDTIEQREICSIILDHREALLGILCLKIFETSR